MGQPFRRRRRVGSAGFKRNEVEEKNGALASAESYHLTAGNETRGVERGGHFCHLRVGYGLSLGMKHEKNGR